MDVTTTGTSLRADSSPRRRTRRRRPRRRGALVWIGPILVLVLVALSVGRFLRPVASPDAPGGGSATSSDAAAGSSEAAAADVTSLEGTTRARPDDPKSWQQLGAAYLRQAIRTSDPAYYGQSRGAFDTAARLAPGDPATWVGHGALALSLHHFDEALAYGRRALDLAPDNPDALGVVVDAEVELGRYDDARSSLQRMLDTRPSLAALSRASYLRELHGDLDGALVAMVQAEAAGGGADGVGTDRTRAFDVATVVTLQGDVLWTAGRTVEAAGRYDRALDLVADLPPAILGRARTAAAQGRTEDAIDALGKLVARLPLPAAAGLLGDLQARANRDAEAARSYELVRITNRLAAGAGAVTDLEQAFFDADHGTDPAATLDEARRAYGARPTVYAADALAWALHRSGDDAAAAPYVEEALRLGTPDTQLHAHAAVVFAAVGQRDRAATELRRAIATNPWFTFAPDALTELASVAGRLDVPVPAAWRMP